LVGDDGATAQHLMAAVDRGSSQVYAVLKRWRDERGWVTHEWGRWKLTDKGRNEEA
jgi:hypothetical protein